MEKVPIARPPPPPTRGGENRLFSVLFSSFVCTGNVFVSDDSNRALITTAIVRKPCAIGPVVVVVVITVVVVAATTTMMVLSSLSLSSYLR